MDRLCMLLSTLNESGDPKDIQGAVDRYFAEIPNEDLAWGVFLLRGGRLKRQCPAAVMKDWCVRASGLPLWLLGECIAASRDSTEAIALILPFPEGATDQQLSRIMDLLKEIEVLGLDRKRDLVINAWRELLPPHRVLFNRLLMGRSLANLPAEVIHRSLVKRTGQREEIIAFRLGRVWHPRGLDLHAVLHRDADTDSTRFVYPFHPVNILETEPESLGVPSSWAADHLRGQDRVQLIIRGGTVHIWSERGQWMEEWRRERFHCNALPDGSVLECSISPERTLTAYDMLEHEGEDIRGRPLEERRILLEAVLRRESSAPVIFAARFEFQDWDTLRRARGGIHDRDAYILLRRKDGLSVSSTRTDPWRIWKPEPLSIDAVLLSVRRSDGGVAIPFSEMTLAVWTGDELVPCARVYPSVPEEELREIVRFVENNTLERFGPVRSVSPLLVFTIGFDAVRKSGRRKSGLELTNARIMRWQRTRRPAEAGTLDQLRGLAMIEPL